MNNAKKMIVAAAMAAAVAVCMADTKTTYRDAQGRVQGTVTTDRYGKTTWRDAQGRVQGSATTDRYGKTTYRDAQGRVQGSKTVKWPTSRGMYGLAEECASQTELLCNLSLCDNIPTKCGSCKESFGIEAVSYLGMLRSRFLGFGE